MIAPSCFTTPKSLPDFQRVFPDENACTTFLYAARFPSGFICPYCLTQGDPYRFKNQTKMLRCRICKRNTRLTAGTIMEKSKMPISIWFWGAWLITSHTPGISALQFQKLLGLTRYETAFQMLHKLRAAMIRPERDGIGSEWTVEVDETWVGGATQGEGSGCHNKTLIIGAVEVRPRAKAPGPDPNLLTGQAKLTHRCGHGRSIIAGRLRLQIASSRSRKDLEPFVLMAVVQGSLVRTDGWTGYDNLAKLGFRHEPLTIRGDQTKTEAHLPMIHTVFGNLDTWLLGTHHGVSPKHLQAYLNEFTFRFNRRFWPMDGFKSVLGIAAQVKAPTYVGLYGKN